MPTVFTHVVPALVGGYIFSSWRNDNSTKVKTLFWFLSICITILPDADAVGFLLGIPYEHQLGHRGASHSLTFALFTAFLFVTMLRIAGGNFLRIRLYIFFFTLALTHPLLDMITSGGLGMAIFWPFDLQRYFFPVRPVRVSAIGGVEILFTNRMLKVLQSELLYIWLPGFLLMITVFPFRWKRKN